MFLVWFRKWHFVLKRHDEHVVVLYFLFLSLLFLYLLGLCCERECLCAAPRRSAEGKNSVAAENAR